MKTTSREFLYCQLGVPSYKKLYFFIDVEGRQREKLVKSEVASPREFDFPFYKLEKRGQNKTFTNATV